MLPEFVKWNDAIVKVEFTDNLRCWLRHDNDLVLLLFLLFRFTIVDMMIVDVRQVRCSTFLLARLPVVFVVVVVVVVVAVVIELARVFVIVVNEPTVMVMIA
jgi:hypothetical protein